MRCSSSAVMAREGRAVRHTLAITYFGLTTTSLVATLALVIEVLKGGKTTLP